jgi:hypothetical protein
MIVKQFHYQLKSIEYDHHFTQRPAYIAAYTFIDIKYMSACKMFQTGFVENNEVHWFIE